MVAPYAVQASPSPNGWVRPPDWPAINILGPTDQGLSGLYAVFNTDANYFSIKITGTGVLTINFGDGTGNYTLTSGVQFDYQFSYANAVAQSGVLAEGYAAVVVNVTTTGTITGINLSVKNATSGLGNYTSQWLDINLGSPNLTSLIISGTVSPRILRNCSILSISNSLTDLTGLFQGCYSLENFYITDTSRVTNFSSMLLNCVSLTSIPLLNTSSGTNFSSMLSGCVSLITVPSISVVSCTAGNFTSMLDGNGSLTKAALANPKVSISFANCNLSTSALYNIFAGLYNSVSGQSVTITGNYGEAKATSCSISSNVLTVGGTVTGTFKVGMNLMGSGITMSGSTYYTILSFGTGTGGAGTYNLTATGSPGSPSGVTVYGVPGNAHTIVANGWSIVN